MNDFEKNMNPSPLSSLTKNRRPFTPLWRSPARMLLIGFVALTFGGCGDQTEKTPEDSPLAMNGTFPIAEPALSNAIIQGNLAEVRKIIDSGENLETRDTLERTPLHMAAFYGRIKTIELLLASGADIAARDHVGMTALHIGVISGGRQTVQLLLDKGADINGQTGAGQTALHLAASTGQPRLTRFLIERGADPHKKDYDGKLPLYYAKKNYHPQTTAVLEQATSKRTSSPAQNPE